MTIAEYCPEQVWMQDMVLMVGPNLFISTCISLLESGERRERAVEYKIRFRPMPMPDHLEPLVAELQKRMKANELFGQRA
jgi:hypothetical protein